MRRWSVVTAMLVALSLGVVTAVVVGADDQPAPGSPASGSAAADPQQLVGTWTLTGEAGFEDREVRLHAGGRLSLRDGGCTLGGGWSATSSGLMIMYIDVASSECRDLDPAFVLFEGVQRYELADEAVSLDDLAGARVALLTDPQPPADPSERYVTPQQTRELPDGVRVPSFETLTDGRWIPVTTVGSDYWPTAKRPHAAFDDVGRWSGSDGCNGLGGRWSMEPTSGQWLASTGGQTEIGCNNVDVSTMIATAQNVGLDGDELVFYGSGGSETGRFVSEDG